MVDYLRIARAYLSGTVAAVWCLLFFCLLFFSAVGEELARDQGVVLLGGLLSRKSYMAMFAYFNACLLGVLLRDNLALPWASVLPRYRQKHLLVTTLIALICLAIPMFSMEFVGTSDIAPTSVAAIFLTCLAAGLWTLHHPLLGFLAFPFLFFVMARSASSSGLAAFLAGTNPAVSAALGFTSLLALWAFAWRMVALKEGTFEYVIARVWGDLFQGRGGQFKTIADHLVTSPVDERAVSRGNLERLTNVFTNLKQVDRLSGYSERSVWQRLQLWRLGTTATRTSANVGGLMVFTLIAIPPMIFIQRLVGEENPARVAVVIFSVQVMSNPVIIWIPWIMRLRRLGYESLRPRTRQEFVRELGLGLLWDIIQCWLGGVLFMGLAAAIWAPELLQVKSMLLFILGTAVGQLCAYAMMSIWFLQLVKRGMVASVLCGFCPFMAIAMWMLLTMNGSIGVAVNLAIALVLAVASVATIPLAYRRWCLADLP